MKKIDTNINTNKNNYVVVGMVVLLLLLLAVYFTNNVSTFKMGPINSMVNINGSNSSKNVATTTVPGTKDEAVQKYASSHFTCDGGKTIDGTFIFEGGVRAELKLTDGKGTRSIILPQDLTASRPVFKSKDGATVLMNKTDGSVSLLESGITTFSNCKAK